MRRIFIAAWSEIATPKTPAPVCSLKYHVVWCPKDRRPDLVPPVDRRLKELFNEVATEYGFLVQEMEVMPKRTRPVLSPRSSTASKALHRGSSDRSSPACALGCRHCGAGPTSPPRSVPSPRRPCAGTSKTRRANDTWPC